MSIDITAALLAEARQECVECGGMGSSITRRGDDSIAKLHCYPCHGRGWVLSERGVALVELLRVGLDPHFAPKDHGHSLGTY